MQDDAGTQDMATGPSAGRPEGARARLKPIVDGRAAERFITGLIVINAIVLGLETSERAMVAAGPLLLALDRAILAIFVIEIGTRIFVHGARFWRDPWGIFDFSVVAIALVPATDNLSVLRALRILRALRLVSTVPSMRRVVGGLLSAIPGMSSVVLLLCLLFYVFSVMATKLFGATFPQWFGTIGASAFSLFQIMTLESWSMGIVRPVMEVYPWAWAFFVPFILVTAFAVLNLFIGIIVDAMQSQHQVEATLERHRTEGNLSDILAELRELRAEVRKLKSPPPSVSG